MPQNAYFLTKFGTDTSTYRRQFAQIPPSSSGGPALRRPGWCSVKNAIWVPSFSRALPCFLLFLGSLLSRRAQYCSYLSFSGWSSIFMFSYGPAQPALGRPQDRLSAASSCASRVLQGAACPPSLAELIFHRHSVACFSSLGPTVLFEWFSAFPDGDAKVCVCVCVGKMNIPDRM